MKAIVPLALVALAGVAALALSGQGAPRKGQILAHDDPAVVAEGAALYAQHCASCHGAALEGQADWRSPLPSGRMPAPPHDASGHTWHHPDAQLVALTTLGVAALVGPGYESDMPGFGEVLGDDQIAATLAFIKSTWPAEIIARHDQINAATAVD